jgi:hypothetical protein
MTYKYWISGDDVAIFRVGDVPEVWPFHSKVLNITNFRYAITFNIFQTTTKWKELFSLKRTTFVYDLSPDRWICGSTPGSNISKQIKKQTFNFNQILNFKPNDD